MSTLETNISERIRVDMTLNYGSVWRPARRSDHAAVMSLVYVVTWFSGGQKRQMDIVYLLMKRDPHILLAVTGSVATVKLPLLCQELSKLGQVRVVSTTSAQHFVDHEIIPNLCGALLTDVDEWPQGWKLGDSVLHIELRRWADILVIAPLSANSMAKIANGMCDNLLTCVARAWDYNQAPMVVAPAMNTLMWSSPLTSRHLAALEQLGAVVVPPVAKKLACGDTGLGAMASPEAIAQIVQQQLQHPTRGSGKTVPAWAHRVLPGCIQIGYGAIGAVLVLAARRAWSCRKH